VKIHLVDGTYELFRAHYGVPGRKSPDGREVGATLGLAASLIALVQREGATHVGVAFDHTVESFRNAMFDGYKSGEGIEPELFAQFALAEEITAALGMVVWPMVEFEADDALASAAARFADAPGVEQLQICTPDKDLAQCVRGQRVVINDRRRREIRDAAAVVEKYGVAPESIPDWLALVGDAADGIPGIPRWGARSAAAALAAHVHVDRIPADPQEWQFKVRGAATLARNLEANREALELYRRLATLREDVPLTESVDDLEWRGAHRAVFESLCESLGNRRLPERVDRWIAE
jgi:5'-3' exonuclease